LADAESQGTLTRTDGTNGTIETSKPRNHRIGTYSTNGTTEPSESTDTDWTELDRLRYFSLIDSSERSGAQSMVE